MVVSALLSMWVSNTATAIMMLPVATGVIDLVARRAGFASAGDAVGASAAPLRNFALALLLGMFVVFQTLSHALVARIRQLGLLRCLGTGTGAITRIFLLDALLLGAVGAALGVGLGLVLALWLQSQRVSPLGLGKE